jgi:hypothetical protein
LFDAGSGMMWSQRLNQYLTANGVALLMINPWLEDQWDWSGACSGFLLTAAVFKSPSAGFDLVKQRVLLSAHVCVHHLPIHSRWWLLR